MTNILDVSSIVYAGHFGSSKMYCGFPIGGIRKLFGLINAQRFSDLTVLCFDSGATLKKELLPSYKAGRTPDYSVLAQIELAKELLLDCNISYHIAQGYEADDLIYSVCDDISMFSSNEKITIYSDDRDLSCCVTSNTNIKNVSTNSIAIDNNNFEERVVKGAQIPLNTILLWKTLNGDRSDNYKRLDIPGLTFSRIANQYVEFAQSMIYRGMCAPLDFSNYEMLEAFAKEHLTFLSEKDMETFLKQARIAYPFKVDVSGMTPETYYAEMQKGVPPYRLIINHLKGVDNDVLNKDKFNVLCNVLGLKYRGIIKSVDHDSKEVSDLTNLFTLRAKELSNGELATKFANRKKEWSNGESLQNMRLPI